MATRQDFQIASDIVRFVNIMNDLVDCISLLAREINPTTGGPLLWEESDKTLRPFTLDEIRTRIARKVGTVRIYRQQVEGFVSSYGVQETAAALECVGVSLSSIQKDMSDMETACGMVMKTLGLVTDKVGLASVYEDVDKTVAKLPLVRRSWCLGD